MSSYFEIVTGHLGVCPPGYLCLIRLVPALHFIKEPYVLHLRILIFTHNAKHMNLVEKKNLALWTVISTAIAACDGGKLAPLQRFSLIENTKKISVKVDTYCPTRQYKDLFVINASYQISHGELKADSDADGIVDIKESSELGLSPYSIDSNQDGYSDLFVSVMGLEPAAQSHLPQSLNTGLDSDFDGLWDADENLLGTKQLDFDTDGDEIPDGLEVRFGADALDAADALLSPANDGISNIDKIKMNLPLRETATEAMKQLAFQYKMAAHEGGCYQFLISNISVMNLQGGNVVRFYFIEQDADGKEVLESRSLLINTQPKEDTVIPFTFEEEEKK